MIDKSEFIFLVKGYMKWYKQAETISNIFNTFTYNSFMNSYCEYLFNTILDNLFTKQGKDDIIWWLWDRDINCFIDEHYEIIPINTVEDLWEMIKNKRK